MGRHWRQLHKLTYAVAVLGWLHLLWLSRSDVGDAVIYGALLERFWRTGYRYLNLKSVFELSLYK